MGIINMHTHSVFSHDCGEPVEHQCAAALEGGFAGLAVTDHCDCEYSTDYYTTVGTISSFETANELKTAYDSRLILLAGIELGDALFDPAFAKKILSECEWDVVLGSVHAVRFENYDMPFSCIDFTDFSDEMIKSYLNTYFNDMTEMLETTDFDILSHLTVPLRYIVKKFGKKVDITEYYPAIENILKLTVESGRTLEINTSDYSANDPFFMPDANITDMYLSLGGRDFSVGSDAHTAATFSKGLHEAAEMLKAKGVNELVYYKNREKLYYSFQ